MRARRKPHFAHRHFERALSGIIQGAALEDQTGRHFGIQVSARKLHRPRTLYTLADLIR